MPFADSDWAPAADIAKPEAQAAQKTADAATTKATAAKSTADAAKSAANNLSKLIRETEDGVDVGKSADGTTYADGTSVTRQGTDGTFSILKVLSGVPKSVASFGYDLIELGKNSASAVITMCGGKLRIAYEKAFSNTPSSIIQATSGDLWLRSDKGDVRLVSITDSDKALGGYVEAVGTRAQLRSEQSSAMGQSGGRGKFAIDGSNVYISVNKDAGQLYPLDNLRSVLQDSGWIWLKGPYGSEQQGCCYRLKAGMVTVSVSLGGDSSINVGGGGTTLGTLPSAYRPASDQIAAASLRGMNGSGQLNVNADGQVKVYNFGGGGVYFAASLCYPL